MSPRVPTPYRFDTDRLSLRCWQPRDVPALHQAIAESDASLRPWVPWARAEPRSLAARHRMVRQHRGRYDLDVDYALGVWSRRHGGLLGGAGLHRRRGPDALEVGYWVHPAHWGQGIATEVTAVLTDAAFRFWPVARVELHMDPRNHASARIPEKLGFTREVVRRGNFEDPAGLAADTAVWVRLRREAAAPPPRYHAYDLCGADLGQSRPPAATAQPGPSATPPPPAEVG